MNIRLHRIATMFLDHLSMSIVIFIPMILISSIVMVPAMLKGTYSPFEALSPVTIVPFLIYFLKDSYQGKSMGKRIIGFQVVDRKSLKPANSLQCFVRNLTIPLWPVEVLVSLVSPKIRIGDLLANTKVIPAEKETIKSIWPEIKKTKINKFTISIILISIIYSYGLIYIFKSLVGYY